MLALHGFHRAYAKSSMASSFPDIASTSSMHPRRVSFSAAARGVVCSARVDLV